MKAFFYALGLAALLAGPRLTQAQGLTNLNLDSWATRNNIEKPVNWLTSDDIYDNLGGQASGTYNFGAVTKTTDKHGGTYAAKLSNVNFAYQGQTYLIRGFLSLGAKPGVYDDQVLPALPAAGAPLAALPSGLQFYYKTANATSADSALVEAYVTGTTTSGPELLGYGYKFLTASSGYIADGFSFRYSTSTTKPDSVHIVFVSAAARKTSVGASLYVDDVVLQGVALATRASDNVQELLTVSPNPSPNGRFVINSLTRPDLAAAPLQVFDLAGRAVLRQAAQASPSGSRELDLSGLDPGIYMLRLDAQAGTIVRPLTIK